MTLTQYPYSILDMESTTQSLRRDIAQIDREIGTIVDQLQREGGREPNRISWLRDRAQAKRAQLETLESESNA